MSLFQKYIHGALEDMRHWYIQHFMSSKHEMNEHTGKQKVWWIHIQRLRRHEIIHRYGPYDIFLLTTLACKKKKKKKGL